MGVRTTSPIRSAGNPSRRPECAHGSDGSRRVRQASRFRAGIDHPEDELDPAFDGFPEGIGLGVTDEGQVDRQRPRPGPDQESHRYLAGAAMDDRDHVGRKGLDDRTKAGDDLLAVDGAQPSEAGCRRHRPGQHSRKSRFVELHDQLSARQPAGDVRTWAATPSAREYARSRQAPGSANALSPWRSSRVAASVQGPAT